MRDSAEKQEETEAGIIGWIVFFVVLGIVATCLDSVPGKVVFGSGVLAIGLLLISWITGAGFLISLAKMCVVVIVIVIVGAILLAIIGS